MKSLNLFFLILFAIPNSQILANTQKSEIILNSLLTEIGHTEKPSKIPDAEPEPNEKETTKIDEEIVDQKPIEEDPTPQPRPAPIPSKGMSHVEQERQKVRDLLKKSHGGVKTGGGAALIEKMKQANRERVNSDQSEEETIPEGDFKQKSLAKMKNLKKKSRRSLNEMKQKVNSTYARWAQKRQEFLKNIKYYKEATIDLDEIVVESDQNFSSKTPKFSQKNLLSKSTSQNFDANYIIVPGALDLEVRDQERRPTCAAFAGIRAIETLLSAEGKQVDLSEQYFYWASKPKCQSSPCSNRGSWVRHALEKSKQSGGLDIPLEKDCPYRGDAQSGNETQIPLTSSCQTGIAKVLQYYKINNLQEVKAAIKRGHPVIAGFKLSPNFYESNGLITLKNRNTGGKMDQHSQGHALVIVGEIELPEKYHQTEGNYCLLISNSWGEGWAKGGHGCISAKWAEKHLVKNALMAVASVKR